MKNEEEIMRGKRNATRNGKTKKEKKWKRQIEE